MSYEKNGTLFISEDHCNFYEQTVASVPNADVYEKALIYTLGICGDTRIRFDSLYDKSAGINIDADCVRAPWQTSGSLRVIRLAANLFTGRTPTAISYDAKDKELVNAEECQLYSVSDIFSYSEYAPYFLQAVKIRFPDGFRMN